MKLDVVKIKKKFADAGANVTASLKRVNQAQGKLIVKDHEKTTRTWSSRPQFRLNANQYQIQVTTDNDVWNMLDAGTRPHDIVARNAPMLVFQGGYKAKTTPNKLTSKSGGSFGSIIRKRRVRHPGTAPRNWRLTIQKLAERRYKNAVRDAIREAVQS